MNARRVTVNRYTAGNRARQAVVSGRARAGGGSRSGS